MGAQASAFAGSRAYFRVKRNELIELGVGVSTVAVLLFTLRRFLTAETSFLHDNLYWEYPVFHYFAESLLNGYLPLWNPYDHGGEAFYPILGAQRLFDPTDALTVWIGGWFTRDTLQLNHWARVVKTLLTLTATYFCVRPWAKQLTSRLALFPLLFFSYYAIGSFREQAYLTLFAGIPLVFLFLQRIVFFDDRRIGNWLALGAFLGLNWQFYHFAPVWTLLLFFLIGLGLFYREGLRRLFCRRAWYTAAIVVGMLGPNLFLYFTQDRYVFPVRMLPKDYLTHAAPLRSPINNEGGPENIVGGARLPYSAAYFSGTVGNTESWIQSLVPDAAYFSDEGLSFTWRFFKDCHGYVGLLAWGLALLGLFFDRGNPATKVWGTCLIGMGLLLLGKGGGIQPLLYFLYPPVSMLRHTAMLMPAVLFPLLFLVVRGLDLGPMQLRPSLRSVSAAVGVTFLLCLALKKIPEDWVWVVLLPLGWALVRWLNASDRLWAVWIGSALAAFSFVPNITAYYVYFFFSFLLFIGWQWKKIASVVLVLVLFADFHTHLRTNSPLFGTRASPVRSLPLSTLVQPPKFPATRELYSIDGGKDPQAIRYLALLYREATAFSTPFASPAEVNTFEKALRAERWNSFLLPRTYFELIHSSAPVAKMEKAFAIGSSTLKFNSAPGNHWKREVLNYRPGNLLLHVETEKDGKLFWSDGYDPDWKATLDGKPVTVEKVLGHFKAIAVPAGDHEIEFYFQPTLFLWSVALFYFFFFTALITPLFLFVQARYHEPLLFIWRDYETTT